MRDTELAANISPLAIVENHLPPSSLLPEQEHQEVMKDEEGEEGNW